MLARLSRPFRAGRSGDDLLAGPIRGDLLGTEGLGERARLVARGQTVRVRGVGERRTPLLIRLDDTARILVDVRARLSAAAEQQADVGPAGEWLLDNAHVIEEHVREVRESLPRSYYGELPELGSGLLAGYPRVYEIATTLIGHTEGRVDRANVDLFVSAFQEVTPLAIGELWAIPAMLRLALIESVRRMALRTVQRLDEVESADRWVAHIVARDGHDDATLSDTLNAFLLGHPPLSPVFVTRFLRQVRLENDASASLAWLEPWLADEGLSAEAASAQSNERLALTQAMTANSITSLRVIAHLDWQSFVENQSRMEAVLRGEAAGVYAGMTFATRDHYRHVVERIARRTGRSEESIAAAAVAFAADVHRDAPSDVARSHVGYYLVDDGLAQLEAATGYRPKVGERTHRALLRHPNLVLIGGIVVGTVAAIVAASLLAGLRADVSWPTLALIAAFVFVPANEMAVSVMNQLITAFLPPHRLPKLDLGGRNGIPAEFRTAVVVPTLFGSVDAVEEALRNLEVQFLANREAHLHFAVLSDFTDADAETQPGDDEIVQAAVDGVHALNARYAVDGCDEFYLFHRPRRWNPQQGVWMGWERKRGKLGEFNRFVRGGAPDAFTTVVGDIAAIRRVRYAITLDSDTVLPPDAAPLLVGAIAHPLNRAVYDAERARIVRGFGILQPRVGVSLPSAYRSPFAAIHSGHPGVDPYTTAVSDVYQDLYGEGSFTGKGIYDIDAFEQATHGRFPENQLLSHDLIEGSYSRAGLVTDIEVFDDYPTSYLAHARRKHRWIRGDWQLLQWVGGRVPGEHGTEPNRLSLLSRWKLLDNLRRSVIEIAQLVLFIAGWTLLPGSPLRWTVLALLAIATPWIVSFLLAAVRPPLDKSWRAYYRAIGHDAVTSVKQVGVTVAFLPHQAWLSADAIIRTLWRMFLSHRMLLQWQSSAHTERTVSGALRDTWRAMWPAVSLAIGVLLLAAMRLLVSRTGVRWDHLLGLLPLVMLWSMSPFIAHALSVPAVRRVRRLSTVRRDVATRYARAHWHFFEQFVNEGTHWLAPDNYQEDPVPIVAMRTSPTNIGLQLLSTLSACDLGFITADRAAALLESTFGTMDKLRRLHGHFFNWYDLHDLRVLEPAYVSTVDSGNLAGHLIAVRQACLDLAEKTLPGDPLGERLVSLAQRAGAFAEAMDFSVLFEPDRELLSIGYQEGTHTLDPSSYDLLASEARLASFVAIARDQVPVDHWFRLGRTLTHHSGATALVSWSGSMFEYLMPALIMRTYPRTVLDQTYQGVVERQIAYAAEHGVPWGISESAYNLRDRHQTYQYRAFGIPDLALKRGLGRDLVVAPYASVLAAMVDWNAALDNLALLEQKGALGTYGFYDALDYTRPLPGKRYAVVRNYMAHHVGMSLVSLANVLLADVWPRRFHNDPLVRSAELLLHERIPRRFVFQSAQAADPDDALPPADLERPAIRDIESPDTPLPRIALLGHQPYTVMIDNRGAGYSRYEGLAVTRWRADSTTDDSGQFCYLKDRASGRRWSATHQPLQAQADWQRAHFATDRVTFQRADGELETRTEITVVPGDAAEVRRVTVTNRGKKPREIELTSYAEIVLATPDADRAHPAFGNLFVQTEWHAWCSALIATRRPRTSTEQPVFGVHVIAVDGLLVEPVSYATDRAAFIGRGRSVADPAALDDSADGALNGSTGAVLDPAFALRACVRIAPGASATVAFTTLVAATRERAFELADRYDDPAAAQRALDLAWTTAQVELRELGITPAEAGVYQDVAGHLLFPNRVLGAPAEERARNIGSQPLLWSIGISGDAPILLASIDSPDGLPTLRQLLQAHGYWRRRGVQVDLVVLNTQPPSYLQDHHDRIMAAVLSSPEAAVMDQAGGVFLRRADVLDARLLLMLRATARVHIPCDGRSLGRVLQRMSGDELEPAPLDTSEPAPRRMERSTPPMVRSVQKFTALLRDTAPATAIETALVGSTSRAAPSRGASVETTPDAEQRSPVPLRFDNGIGGLTAADDYEIRLQGDTLPPAPWANVIANARGGFVVTERGGGFTWAENSYFYRLTPWHNDPVSDPLGEVLYLRDEDTGDLWSATPAPVRHASAYTVTHAPGKSEFQHMHSGIRTHLALGVALDEPVKLSILTLTNTGSGPRRISVTAFVEWTLGVNRETNRHHIHTQFDAARRAIMARNTFDEQFAGQRAFLTMSAPVAGHTADRREFLGRNGSTRAPAALSAQAGTGADRVRPVLLQGRVGGALDPCGALHCVVELAPGETREVSVALGAGVDDADAARLAEQFNVLDASREAMLHTVQAWEDRLSVVRVMTPEPSFDAMVNRWAPYQALACRMWARSAFYQSSGAYGFRDQLQDTMAFVYAEPELARAHLLRAAARQFVEGDVQHWWHPQSGRGVRTRFSDDLAWLPYVAEHYMRVSGDTAVLDEYVPFLAMRTLAPHEHELYDLPTVTDEHGSLYEHCLRALRRACTTGAHGLPLIGIGDWNDGMSRVGVEGRGESVWLAWFLVTTLRAFAPYAAARGDTSVATEFLAQAERYAHAVEEHGWDGAWYRRAYFDDGTPMGSSASDECRIDAIAQSWSVISGAGDPARQAIAMRSLEAHLVRDDARLLLLLTPPFNAGTHDPGYIKGYLPGVRENGAQYTHAALWSVLATAERGDVDRAFELFQMINPLMHARTADEVATYKVEPYVVAADVYTADGQLGRGGWTWYTGSASWLYRVALETILGFSKRGATLTITPRIPRDWPGYSIEYRVGRARYAIRVQQVDAAAASLTVDGQPMQGLTLELVDDGASHTAELRVPVSR